MLKHIELVDYVKTSLKKCKEINNKYNYFNKICEKQAIKQAEKVDKKLKKGKLAGLLVSVKDNICVKDIESTAGSRILKNYKPVFDATAVERLKKEDAIIIGKTSCDAFGFGSFSTNVGLGFKIPKNPHDITRATGGSSGGSAGITKKADFAHASIGVCTGGSIENPASFCGVIGFCPTYGRISRYGLISYANSLDKIGIISKKVDDIYAVLKVVSGFDKMDETTIKEKLDLSCSKKSFRIGVIKESFSEGISKEVKEALNKTIKKLEEQGFKTEKVSLPVTFGFGVPVYYTIATAEASTNLARYSGMRYGEEDKIKGKFFEDYFSEIRSRNFNKESKRRIILGTFARMSGYRDAYYIKATKVRTKIIEEYKKLFKKYDVLISPTMPFVAPKFSEIKKKSPIENYLADILTVGSSLAGIPHASIPIGKSGKLPIGMSVMADHFNEGLLLKFLKIVEDLK